MATIDSVARGLKDRIAQIAIQGGRAAIPGRNVFVRRGYLLPEDQTGDCSIATRDLILVDSVKGAYRTIPWPMRGQWYDGGNVASTVEAAANSDGSITVSTTGVPSGIIAAGTVTGAYAAYAVAPSDTAASIAASLSSALPGSTATGATVVLPGHILGYQVSGYSRRLYPLRRQEQMFTVSIWSSSPDAGREPWTTLVDTALADDPWISVSDGTRAQAVFAGAAADNSSGSQGQFGEVLTYMIRFTTVRTVVLPHVMNFAVAFGDSVTGDRMWQQCEDGIIYPNNAVKQAV